MDEVFAVFCVAFIVVGVLAGAGVLHEYLESDYDKCLDSCGSFYRDKSMEQSCTSECNSNFRKCEETKEEGDNE